jgi:NAD(P)-dependent dehydrogenase (short-subunit alcohol dehydrogenase family)
MGMKTILITGCSSGIGLATAKLFAAQGWNVVATARNTGTLGSWAPFTNVLPLQLDVTDEASIREAVAATEKRFGRIDVLVNNAGYGLFGPIEGATAEQFEAQFRTNVFGAVAMIRHVLPLMRKQQSGTIVNVSSLSGRFGSAFLAPYTATKYALEGLSESLRFELAPHNIHVKVVEPGHFKSEFITQNLQWSEHTAYEPQLDNMKAWVAQSMARADDPKRVAETIFRAATEPSGRLRFSVGDRALRVIHTIVPDALWRRMLGAGMNRRPRTSRAAQAFEPR